MLVNKGFLLIVLNYYIRGSQGKLALTWLQLRPRLPIDPVVVVFNSGMSKNEPGQLGPASEVEVDQLVGLAGHGLLRLSVGGRMNKCQPRSATSQLFSSGLPCPRQPPPLPAVFTVNCTHTHAHALTCTHMHSHTLSLSLPQACSYTNTTYLHIHAHYCLTQTHTHCPHTHIHSTPHTLPYNTSHAFSVAELQTFNFSFFPFAIGSVTDAVFLALALSYSLSLALLLSLTSSLLKQSHTLSRFCLPHQPLSLEFILIFPRFEKLLTFYYFSFV